LTLPTSSKSPAARNGCVLTTAGRGRSGSPQLAKTNATIKIDNERKSEFISAPPRTFPRSRSLCAKSFSSLNCEQERFAHVAATRNTNFEKAEAHPLRRSSDH